MRGIESVVWHEQPDGQWQATDIGTPAPADGK
jgi:hypothetical protein